MESTTRTYSDLQQPLCKGELRPKGRCETIGGVHLFTCRSGQGASQVVHTGVAVSHPQGAPLLSVNGFGMATRVPADVLEDWSLGCPLSCSTGYFSGFRLVAKWKVLPVLGGLSFRMRTRVLLHQHSLESRIAQGPNSSKNNWRDQDS